MTSVRDAVTTSRSCTRHDRSFEGDDERLRPARIERLRVELVTHALVNQATIIAAREQVHLPGDPDGIDEGVLNVAGF